MTTKKLSAGQMIRRLTEIECAAEYADQPDLRRVMRDERFALTAAVKAEHGGRIADCMAETVRVADMWGVDL